MLKPLREQIRHTAQSVFVRSHVGWRVGLFSCLHGLRSFTGPCPVRQPDEFPHWIMLFEYAS